MVTACTISQDRFSEDFDHASDLGTIGAYEEFLANYAHSVEGTVPFHLYKVAYLTLEVLKAEKEGRTQSTAYDAFLRRFSARENIDRVPVYPETEIRPPAKPKTLPSGRDAPVPPMKALPLTPVQQKALEKIPGR